MLKKFLITTAAIAFTLAMCFSAVAKPQSFANGVTVDVPDGWEAQEIPASVILSSNTETAVVTITRADNEGQSLEELAGELSAQFDSTKPVLENGQYVMKFVQNGLDCVGYLSVEGETFTFIALIGGSDKFDAIRASVK